MKSRLTRSFLPYLVGRDTFLVLRAGTRSPAAIEWRSSRAFMQVHNRYNTIEIFPPLPSPLLRTRCPLLYGDRLDWIVRLQTGKRIAAKYLPLLEKNPARRARTGRLRTRSPSRPKPMITHDCHTNPPTIIFQRLILQMRSRPNNAKKELP